MNDPTIHTTIDLAIDAISRAEDQLRDARRALLKADYEARQKPSDEMIREEVQGWIAEASEAGVKAARKLAEAKLNEAPQKPREGTLQTELASSGPQTAGEVLKRIRERPEPAHLSATSDPKASAGMATFNRVEAWVKAHLGHFPIKIETTGQRIAEVTVDPADAAILRHVRARQIEPVLDIWTLKIKEPEPEPEPEPQPRTSLIDRLTGWLKGGR